MRSTPTQSGYTLIELMIGMVLGLMVVAGVLGTFISSRMAFRTQEALGQVQEMGRIANFVLLRTARLAGFLPDPLNQTNPAVYFSGDRLALFGKNNQVPGYTGIADARSDTDVLVVSYAGGANPVMKSCLGNDVAATEQVTNVFYLSTTPTGGVSSLRCAAKIEALGTTGTINFTGTGPQPLLAGVTDFQITFGFDNDGDLITNRFYRADEIQALVTDLANPDPAAWSKVTAVRISLTILANETTETGITAPGATSGRIKRDFTSLVATRNRLIP